MPQPDTDSHSHSYSDSYSNADGNLYAYGNGHGNRNAYRNGDAYCYHRAQDYTDAQPASHATATPISSSGYLVSSGTRERKLASSSSRVEVLAKT